MKRIHIVAFICILVLQFSAHAQVSTTVTDDDIRGVIEGTIVSKTAGEPVLLHMRDADSNTIHIDEQYSGENGAYHFNFIINPDFGGGKYSYSVSTVENTEETGTVLIQDITGIKNLCEAMQNAVSAEEIKTVFENFNYVTENTSYDSLDKSDLYRLFYYAAREELPLDAEKTVEIMEKIIFLETANQNKLSGVIDSDGKIIPIESLGLSPQDLEYYNSISSAGLKNVSDNLQGKGFQNADEMLSRLKGLIYVNTITNNRSIGIGNADEILTEQYAYLGINLSDYNAASDAEREEILRTLVNSSIGNIGEFQAAYAAAVKSKNTDTPPQHSSGGSGGGGTGAGVYIPSVQTNSVPAETVKTYNSGFSDMQEFEWAQEAVSILKENKIIYGKTDTEFAPYDSVTREEFLAMLLRAVPLEISGQSTGGAYEFVKGDSFDGKTVNSWSRSDQGIDYSSGVLSITSGGGEVMQTKRYDSTNVLSALSGDSMEAEAAYAQYKIAISTKMTVLSGESGYTELALLDGDEATKVHLVRLEKDGEQTFRVLINQSSAGINSGITNEILSDIPYGTMVDVCVIIQENVADFYINGEKAGSTNYTTGIPTWSSGIKLYSADGTATMPFTGAFDDMAVYFQKATEELEFTVTDAFISDGKINLLFSTQPSEFAPFAVEVNGEEIPSSISGIEKKLSIDYPVGDSAVVRITNGGKDIFGSTLSGETEFDIGREEVAEEVLFQDVSEDAWYYESVTLALNLNIVEGISQDMFGTEEDITRQDMAVMAFRALRYTNADIDTQIADIEFTDQEDMGDYAIDYVKILKKMQIINGYSDGSFRPQDTANRAEAAQIVYKIYSLCNEK